MKPIAAEAPQREASITSPQSPSPASPKPSVAPWILVAVLGVATLAISGRSLWIDEACTAMKVLPTTLGGWWQALSQDRSADLQMPLYMFYAWGWCRIFGTGEWSLHAANVPWFVAGAAAFLLAFPTGDRRRAAAACVVLLCPFAWYYLDEARPYTMQLGASLLIVGGLMRMGQAFGEAKNIQHPTSNIQHPMSAERPNIGCSMFLLGLVVLSGSSLLGMVWAGAAVLALPAVLPLRGTLTLLKRCWYLWLPTVCLLLLFAGYYLWTLSLGARASASATTTIGSMIFIGYELMGFSGLGPGRLELRSAGPVALRSFLPVLALYAAVVASLVGAAVLHLFKWRNRRHLLLLLCCGLPAVFILSVGCIAHFRVLGRHFTPLLPLLLLLLALGLAALWSRGSAWSRAAVLVFCGLSLASCLSLRFAVRHQKDDYRAAAAQARTSLSRGQAVWWNAAEEGARYYQVPVVRQPGNGNAALLVLNPTAETLTNLPTPQTVVASKPDVYDGQGALAEYLRQQRFIAVGQLCAFTIWEKHER